jgi:flagellar basal body P-ring formation protein FlgA
MGRLIVAAILLGAAAVAPPPATGQARMQDVTGALPRGDMPVVAPRPKPTLRRSVVVTSDVVRIGDLVDNAGPFADIAVFRSPDVGTTGSVPARKVIDAARAHNLLDIDSADVVDVEVSHTGHVVTKLALETRIARLFSGTNGLGEPEDLVVRFDREVAKFSADVADAAELKAMRAFYDAHSNRFEVLFEVPTGISRHVYMRYTGSLVETTPAVVPTRTIARGEVVRTADLAIERRPKGEVVGDIVVAVGDAVGRAARQALRQGSPLRRADLMTPELVKREDNVTLVYEVPGITLTTRGKALEGGSEGDTVSVVTVQNKRTVQGIVAGPGLVRLATPGRTATLPANGATGNTE